jgi:hypothetical protein
MSVSWVVDCRLVKLMVGYLVLGYGRWRLCCSRGRAPVWEWILHWVHDHESCHLWMASENVSAVMVREVRSWFGHSLAIEANRDYLVGVPGMLDCVLIAC